MRLSSTGGILQTLFKCIIKGRMSPAHQIQNRPQPQPRFIDKEASELSSPGINSGLPKMNASASKLICTTEADCCARVLEMGPERILLEPDTPASVPGNGQYYLCTGVFPHQNPLVIEIQWPQTNSTHLPGFQYPENENFSTVLDQVCFTSHDRKHWTRLEDCHRTRTGVKLKLPPSNDAQWLSIGIPYFAEDLKDLLAVVEASNRCELTEIGSSRLGRPLHGIWVPPERPDKCRGLFLLQAYQHHTEWAGLHAIDEFLRRLVAGSMDPGDFAWSIVPCINVDALHGGSAQDLIHLEPDQPHGGNFNRDWQEFTIPETRAARDFHLKNATQYPVLHGLDLHMGWSTREASGGGLTSFLQGQLPMEASEIEQRFTETFFQHVPIEDFSWQVSALDRPNFAAWVWREFSAIGQTVEVSRFRAFGKDRQPRKTSQDYYRQLGPSIARALIDFYSRGEGLLLQRKQI
jgi:hypothetical protein